MARIIGIDYGSKRVGVAVSDDGHGFAFPKVVLPNDTLLLDRLATIALDENATLFVLGESDNPAGGTNTIMRRIVLFGKALEVRTELPVAFVDEAFSSAEARRGLLTDAKRRQQRTNVAVDAAAAAIILQKYLDTHVSSQKHRER